MQTNEEREAKNSSHDKVANCRRRIISGGVGIPTWGMVTNPIIPTRRPTVD